MKKRENIVSFDFWSSEKEIFFPTGEANEIR